MQNEQQLLAYFQNAIQKEAEKERLTLLDEAKEIREEALNKIRQAASLDAKRRMEKEISEIILENQKEISTMQRKTNATLIAKRQELQNEVFKEAKEALSQFVESEKYYAWMQKQFANLPAEILKDGIEMHVRTQDEAMMNDLLKVSKVKVKMVIDETITLGGFKVFSLANGFIVDESLDYRLENCQEWFYNHSGFVIQ